MPRRRRPGNWQILYVELPAELQIKERLDQLARDNRRTLPQELVNILQGLLPPLRSKDQQPREAQ